MNEQNTKWVNEISVKYNAIIENYKNIELFENIYNTEEENKKSASSSKVEEGFKIFDDFDIHKKPKGGYRFKGAGAFFELLSAIKDYILCPIYKSDELVDNAIQGMVNVFLEVRCGDKESPEEPEDVQIIDLSNLIQPDLLYREEFKNKKSQSDINCENRQKKAAKDSKRYTSIIKNELYKILCIPIVIHILYNSYYLFFFKDSMGARHEFIDVEKEYYAPNFKTFLGYFLDVIVKPVTYLYWIFEYISKQETLHVYSDKYPYVFFISMYILLYLYIGSFDKNLISVIGDLLTMKRIPASILTFSTVIIVVEFFKTFINETIESWGITLITNPMVGTILYLIYWFLRMCFTSLLYKFSTLLCIIYIMVYVLFGIQFSQSKDTFDVYSEIDDSIYQKIYKIFNEDCDPYNRIKMIVQFISKYGFIYLTELTILMVLSFGFYNYRSIDNANMLSFLYIVHFTGIIILLIWSFAKYKSFVKPLDLKYGIK